jgi:uncharacterized protein YbcV (DUF1398 family)
MKFLESYDDFSKSFDSDNELYYMFDIPEPWSNYRQIMLSNTFQRFSEIRPVFYNTDLSKLEDFSVIINIHSDGNLGTYIVHNDWIEKPFLKSDDFDVCFSIKDYNKMKKVKKLTKDINFFDELERFKNDNASYYNWYQNKDNIKYLDLKTKWTIVNYDDKPISLMSEHDSWRIPNQISDINELEELKYTKFRVKSLEEGLEYLKM